VSTRYSQTDWNCLHCHAVYEHSLATVSASTADETPFIPDLYIVHPLLYGSEAWTLLQEDLRKLEAFHIWHVLPAYDPWDTLAEVADTTNLPCIKDIITRRRNSPLGHVVRLDDHTPAHHALSQVVAIRTGSCPPGWCRRTGRPRNSWLQQITDGTPFGIRAEWTRARRRGHTGLGWRLCDLMTMMMIIVGVIVNLYSAQSQSL